MRTESVCRVELPLDRHFSAIARGAARFVTAVIVPVSSVNWKVP